MSRIVLVARLRRCSPVAAGYWGVVRSAGPGRRPERRGGHRRPPRTVPRGRILDRTARSWPTTRRMRTASSYRVYADAAVSPVVGYASRTLRRAGLERSYDAELTGLAERPGRGRPSQVPGRPVRPEGPDPVAVAATSSGRRSAAARERPRARWSCSTRGPARSSRSRRRRPTTHRRSPTRRPRRRPSTGLQRRPRPAAPAAGDAGPLRAGLGLQDRHRGGRPRLGCDHARRRRSSSSRPPRRPACWSTASGSATAITRRPARHALDLAGATEVSCNIWLRPDRARDRRREPRDVRGRGMGFGAADPVRPADRDLAGHQRRRAAAGRLRRRRRARERGLRPGRDAS